MIFLKFIFITFLMLPAGSARSEKLSISHFSKLSDDGSVLSIASLKDGKYAFSFQNGMSRKTDIRSIVFKNKKDAKSLLKKIGKILSSKDGTSEFITYSNYNIRLLSGIGGVFMIVDEKGMSQSTFRISKENYAQLNNI